MIFKAIPNEASGCIAYLIGCEREGVAAVIDAGRADVDGCVELARARGLTDRKSTRLNSSHIQKSRMPSSA